MVRRGKFQLREKVLCLDGSHLVNSLLIKYMARHILTNDRFIRSQRSSHHNLSLAKSTTVCVNERFWETNLCMVCTSRCLHHIKFQLPTYIVCRLWSARYGSRNESWFFFWKFNSGKETSFYADMLAFAFIFWLADLKVIFISYTWVMFILRFYYLQTKLFIYTWSGSIAKG